MSYVHKLDVNFQFGLFLLYWNCILIRIQFQRYTSQCSVSTMWVVNVPTLHCLSVVISFRYRIVWYFFVSFFCPFFPTVLFFFFLFNFQLPTRPLFHNSKYGILPLTYRECEWSFFFHFISCMYKYLPHLCLVVFFLFASFFRSLDSSFS